MTRSNNPTGLKDTVTEHHSYDKVMRSKHASEAMESFQRHEQVRQQGSSVEMSGPVGTARMARRRLKHHGGHHHKEKELSSSTNKRAAKLESALEDEYRADYPTDHAKVEEKRHHHDRKKHRKRMKELLADPALISELSVHGMMIDAGSTGSRLHVYEWDPRILTSRASVESVVSGAAHSVPGTESRWTDRLGPGLASFAMSVDDSNGEDDTALVAAVADYLQPLLDFAQTVLASKKSRWNQFPIFLRATAGMRLLEPHQRSRVMNAVRTALRNATVNPFLFTNDQASVLSGEEEAAYDWVGVNFLLNDELLQSSSSEQLVSNSDLSLPQPQRVVTYGALDMGGASTQISFYEPNEDIMSNLFKLQIGQAKRWNIYAHSFLFYGINAATERFQARLMANKTSEERLIQGIYNPCLPGGGNRKQDVRTNIHLTESGVETLAYEPGLYPSGDGTFQAILVNDHKRGDAEHCLELARDLLHLEKNDWCEFAHKGDCSLAGIYQPRLPRQGNDEVVREFVAFSNYYNVWQFLQLPERATIAQLQEATRNVCSMSHSELVHFNNGKMDESELDGYCFRSAYALTLLHDGYGFQLDDTIRATQVIAGQKVGWALGAMLYEINAMPWRYEATGATVKDDFRIDHHGAALSSTFVELALLVVIVLGVMAALLMVFVHRERKLRNLYQYEPIKDVSISV